MVLPYIDMNSPQVYMCSPSWTPFHFPPHPIPLGHPSAPAPSTLSHALNLDWRSISHMIMYMFQCHSPKSSHPRPLPQCQLFHSPPSLYSYGITFKGLQGPEPNPNSWQSSSCVISSPFADQYHVLQVFLGHNFLFKMLLPGPTEWWMSWDGFYNEIFKESKLLQLSREAIFSFGGRNKRTPTLLSQPGRTIIFLNCYWRIAVLQCCISFCHSAEWFSYMYTHIPYFLDFLPI